MKKIIIPLFLLTISFFITGAADFSFSVKKNDVYDYLEALNLTPAQRKKAEAIRKEEMIVVDPLALDVQSKERGLEFLYSLECKWNDSVCKSKLKEDIEQRELEKREADRRILQKKNYYKLRYKNLLTHEQNAKLNKLIEENEHKEKVLTEREQRAERQAKIDKLKVWRKLPEVKNKFKKKN